MSLFVTHFSTSGPIKAMETWLTSSAKGTWQFKLAGMSDDMSKRKYSLSFELASDRDLFREKYTPKKS